MPRLTDYQYNEILKTGSITLLCGPEKEPVPISKGFGAYYSEFLACLIAKAGFEGTVELPNVPVTAAKSFSRWSYAGARLDPINFNSLKLVELRDEKHRLIDLWLFGDIHQIPKLQNQTMGQLRNLFCQDLTLLSADDLSYVFNATSNDSPLRHLVLAVLVAKVDMGKDKVEDYDGMARAYEGFFSMFVVYQKMWLMAYGKLKQKDKEKKLAEMLGSDEMTLRLKMETPTPPEWVLVLSGAKPKPMEPGEVIELD